MKVFFATQERPPTDPASGEVWMGARWYSGGDAAFRSRDTVFGQLSTPISLNRHTYGYANPMTYWDPDGRLGVLLDGAGAPIAGHQDDGTLIREDISPGRAERHNQTVAASQTRTYYRGLWEADLQRFYEATGFDTMTAAEQYHFALIQSGHRRISSYYLDDQLAEQMKATLQHWAPYLRTGTVISSATRNVVATSPGPSWPTRAY